MTEGFMVTKSVLRPTSRAYSCTGARLHLQRKRPRGSLGKLDVLPYIKLSLMLFLSLFLLIAKDKPRVLARWPWRCGRALLGRVGHRLAWRIW
jgi:hypothetical protein